MDTPVLGPEVGSSPTTTRRYMRNDLNDTNINDSDADDATIKVNAVDDGKSASVEEINGNRDNGAARTTRKIEGSMSRLF